MKYGLFAAIAFGAIALIGGAASAGVATSGLARATVAPAASAIQHVGWRCFREHGGGYWQCKHHCY